VTKMAAMFKEASAFKRSIRGWNVGNVKDRKSAFDDCPLPKKERPKLGLMQFW